MDVGSYLFSRIRQAGAERTFSLPGDFALPLFEAQARERLATSVCTHEPSAAFAADAYARLRGFGCVVVTYGAGALNVVNPVAMSWAEHTPVLVVSAAPRNCAGNGSTSVHHMVKSLQSQERIFREVTVESVVLSEASSAVSGIDRVISSVLREKRPGYIEIPCDLVSAPLPKSNGPVIASAAVPRSVDKAAIAEAVDEIIARLRAARHPVLYVGVNVQRRKLTNVVRDLSRRWNLPVATSVMGKAAFPESDRCFAGIYIGALGDPQTRQIVEKSDCVLTLGVINSDVNSGFGTAALDASTQIVVDENEVRVGHHCYEHLPMEAVVHALATRPASRRNHTAIPRRRTPLSTSGELATAEVLGILDKLDLKKFSVITDVGDCWLIGLELRTDVFLAPGYYATMGFAVPAALGAGLAEPSRRPLVLVGDGAFRMTGLELVTLRRERIPAIVVVLNNQSYAMLEALHQPREYCNLPSIDHVALARACGCNGERCESAPAFAGAVERALASDAPYVIEAVLNKHDWSPILRKIHAHAHARGS